jgi:hypothetical protein
LCAQFFPHFPTSCERVPLPRSVTFGDEPCSEAGGRGRPSSDRCHSSYCRRGGPHETLRAGVAQRATSASAWSALAPAPFVTSQARSSSRLSTRQATATPRRAPLGRVQAGAPEFPLLERLLPSEACLRRGAGRLSQHRASVDSGRVQVRDSEDEEAFILADRRIRGDISRPLMAVTERGCCCPPRAVA